MKIVIPGGSGQVGTLLARAFHRDGHDVTVLSRVRPDQAHALPWRVLQWDAASVGAWSSSFEDADVVVNLAGRNVNCRYHRGNRREIMDSRVRSTRAVGAAIARADSPPRVWLQASTATIYAHRYDAANDERTGIIGGNEPGAPDTWNFSIDVARAWEHAVDETETPRTRKVQLRSAMVMSPDAGGIFDTLLTLVRRGLGGTAAGGRQYISWIHELDFIRSLYWLVEHQEMSGPVNVASPNPLPNESFMRILRQSAGAPIGLPATKWMLEIGAFLIRTETELILKSRRVVPGRMLEAGFDFVFPDWERAARDLCARSAALAKGYSV